MKEDWEYKKLGEVCETSSGGTPSKSHIEYYEGGTIPWLRSGEVAQGMIYDSELYITELGLKNSSAKLFPIDTVVIAMYGATVGQVGVLKKEMATNQAICGVLPSKTLYPNFLMYCMKAKKPFFLKDAVGGAQPNISQNIIKNTIIPVPDISEQLQILSELDLLSGAIEKQKAQLEEMDKLAQSTFYDMFGDPVTNDKKWEKTELEKTCLYITDGDHMPPPKANCGIPFITISDIDKVHREIIFDDTFFVPIDYYNSLKEERKAKNGDVLYTVTGSYGIPVVINSDKEFCFQRHIALLRPDKEKLNTSFLCYWVLCDSVKHMADDVATGIAQKTVGLSSLRKFSIILPPLALQQEFAAKVEAIEQMKAKVRQSLKESEELFNNRMDYYFN